MKNMYCCLLVLFCLDSYLLNCQEIIQPNEFTLAGKVTGRDTGTVVLCYFDAAGNLTGDTIHLKNGAFQAKGSIKGPTISTIIGSNNIRLYDDPYIYRFFLEPGAMTIDIPDGDFQASKLNGSQTQEAWNELKLAQEPYRKYLRFLTNRLQKTLRDSIANPLPGVTGTTQEKIDACVATIKEMQYSFIALHPASCLSPYLLATYRNDISDDSARILYAKFTENVKNSYSGRTVAATLQTRAATLSGNLAPDFKRMSLAGHTIKLSSFRSKKIVLLDFWASWCIPCRAQSSELKQLYRKYHAKGFEIISISRDDDEQKWKEAVKYDGITAWPNVRSHDYTGLTASDKDDMENKFSIAAFPTLILIDKDGKIIGRRGRNEPSEKTLSQWLKEVIE